MPLAYLSPFVLERLVAHRRPCSLSIKDLIAAAERPWCEQEALVFESSDSPANPADILRQIDIQADAIANQQIAQIEADSKNAYVQSLNKGASLTAALGAADVAAAAAIDELTSDASAMLVSGYINHGRNVVFDKNADDIYALQRSKILDQATCNYCLLVDGRVVEE